MKNVAILGATGSIGMSTLDVMSLHPEKYNVFALSANSNWKKMEQLCIKHMPKFAVMANEEAAQSLRKVAPDQVTVLQGESALNDIASHQNTDFVMAAIVGSAGLSSTFAAVTSGKRVMLANKESLVLGGNLLTNAAKKYGAELIPVDSEHSAIFQCLQGGKQGLNKIQLTASGGPFLKLSPTDLCNVTPIQACKHPKWKMG
jgi:1-deoxy-D-xylulose-5-phosphate reductoisomerase